MIEVNEMIIPIGYIDTVYQEYSYTPSAMFLTCDLVISLSSRIIIMYSAVNTGPIISFPHAQGEHQIHNGDGSGGGGGERGKRCIKIS